MGKRQGDKAISRLVAYYSAPINMDNMDRTHLCKENTQDAMQAIIDEDHLHVETNVLAVKPHTHIFGILIMTSHKKDHHQAT